MLQIFENSSVLNLGVITEQQVVDAKENNTASYQEVAAASGGFGIGS